MGLERAEDFLTRAMRELGEADSYTGDSICHGFNYTPTRRTHKRNDEGTIDYDSGNKLTYYRGEDGFSFDYTTGERTIRLNDLGQNGEWLMVPVDSGFYVRLSEDGVALPRPEIQLNIPLLEEDEIYLLAALHECGHAFLYDTFHSLIERIPPGKEVPVRDVIENTPLHSLMPVVDGRCIGRSNTEGRYSEQLVHVGRFFKLLDEQKYRRVSERFAWANALRALRKLQILDDLDRETVRKWYRDHLQSYGESFVHNGSACRTRGATSGS